ncbi:MAG: VWA domain-containing protein, partial [Acidobacteriota bacterium]|nr:VWA domain-containing protein [Acidobacteriota bacterium]
MKLWNKLVLASLPVLLAIAFVLQAQEGPKREGSETVAKPRKKDAGTAEDSDLPKIPSKLSNKSKGDVVEGPSFKVESNVVNLDVSVLDNKGHFIPGIPKGAFRVLEDNVPQHVTNFSLGEGPMTVCMV